MADASGFGKSTLIGMDAEDLSDGERQLLVKMFSAPLLIPDPFKNWLVAWLQLQGYQKTS